MKNLSHVIEKYILDMFEEAEDEDSVTMRRKELAEIFECVPSQINYVLRSRFTPEQGYLIESRRGEYGYIKIYKISCENSEQKAEHVEDLIGNQISLREAARLLKSLQDRKFITARERLLIEIALRHTVNDEKIIAVMLKTFLCALVMEQQNENRENTQEEKI